MSSRVRTAVGGIFGLRSRSAQPARARRAVEDQDVEEQTGPPPKDRADAEMLRQAIARLGGRSDASDHSAPEASCQGQCWQHRPTPKSEGREALPMPESLIDANPFLRDPQTRRAAVRVSAASSSAVEGIRKPFAESVAKPGAVKGAVRRKSAASGE